jgi:hypothetical protein
LSCRIRRRGRAAFNCYRVGNHVTRGKSATAKARALASKILDKLEPVEFYEKSRRIRIDFAQNPRFIANDSFKPVC